MNRRRLAKFGKGVLYAALALVGLTLVVAVAGVGVVTSPWGLSRGGALLSSTLNEQLQGHFEVAFEGARLGLGGVEGIRAQIKSHKDGTTLVHAEDLRVSWSARRLLDSLRTPTLDIELPRVTIARAHVDVTNVEAFAQAFALRSPNTSGEAPRPEPSVVLKIADARLEEVTADVPGPDGVMRVFARDVTGSVLVDDDVVVDAGSPHLTADVRFSQAARALMAFGGAHAVVHVPSDGPLLLTADYSGKVGEVLVEANAALIERDWWATADLHAQPDAIAGLELGWQPQAALDVTASAAGNMKSAAVLATVRAEQSDVRMGADITFEPLRIRGLLQGEHLDPSDLIVGAQSGFVSVHGHVDFTPQVLSAALRSSAGRYGQMNLPPARIQLDAKQLARYQLDVVLEDESAARLRAQVEMGERVVVHATFDSRRLPREASKQLGNQIVVDGVRFAVDAEANDRFELLKARADGVIRRLSVPAADLQVTDLSTTVAMDDASRVDRIRGRLTVGAVSVGRLLASNLSAAVEPFTTENHLRVTAGLRLRPDAPVHPVQLDVAVVGIQPVKLRTIRVLAGGNNEQVRLDVASVHQLGQEWKVNNAALVGVGKLRLDGQIGRNTALSVAAEQLDLTRLSALLAPLVPPASGWITGRSEMSLAPGSELQGFLDIKGAELAFAGLEHVELAVRLDSDGRALNGNFDLFQGNTRLEATIRDTAIVNVRRMFAESERVTLADFSGALALSLRTTGPDLAVNLDQPNLSQDVSLWTNVTLDNIDQRGLRFSAKTTALMRRTQGAQPNTALTPEEVSLVWSSEFAESDPHWRNHLRLAATGISTLESEVVIDIALATAPLSELPQLLLQAPVRAKLDVAKIDLSLLPRDLPLPGLEGTLEAKGELRGTLGVPEARVELTVTDLQVQSIERSLAVTVRASAQYVAGGMHVDYALTHDGSKVASGRLTGNWQTQRFLVDARFDDISLGCLPYVRDYGVEGHLTGYVELDVSEEPEARVYFLGRGFKVNGALVPYWSLQGNVGKGEGIASLTLIEPTGSARLTVSAAEMGATLADLGPVRVTAAMKDFQLRPLLGFIGGVVRDGSGVVNGNLEAEFLQQSIEASGSLVLRDGSLLVPVLGREFTGLNASVRAEPGKLSLHDVKGRFGTGRFKGEGRLAYDENANLKAHLELRVPSDAPVPIAREGRDVAQMSGKVEVVAKAKNGAEITSEVLVSNLKVDVSQESEQVLSLAAPEYAVVGYRDAKGKFATYGSEEAKPADTKEPVEPVTLTLKLGRDVWVHRGQGTFASLEGGLTLLLGSDVRSEGVLRIPEGRIDVMGRVFQVQPSTVTFGGTDMDPEVVAEANWLSPSGHTVIATFRGPVSSGKMQLRSEPALSYGEILNVLLFDDPTGAPDSGAPPTATSVAGTLVGAGLGRTLSDLTSLDLQANVQTTESGSTRPEIGIRISPRLALQVSYNTQPVVSLTEPPDQAQVSLDWRISKGWSLESKLGNQGSASADLAWQYRY